MKTNEKLIFNIEDVKNQIALNVGKRVCIQESNRQGKILKEYIGEIIGAYDRVFIVRVQIRENYLNKSFSYVDFLTNEMFYTIIN